MVTKDADFRDQGVLEGFPPKVIGLRVGNCTTAAAVARLQGAKEIIDGFLADPEWGVLELRSLWACPRQSGRGRAPHLERCWAQWRQPCTLGRK